MSINDKRNIAILIDGDNAQPKLIGEIIEEVSKHGNATMRRIYGDWTSPQMNGWKKVINSHSISPIQKFNYTVGKNSTDGQLIIDAMDILHQKNIQGFCIVSSDSDFTGLAKRIREDGLFVMGIGEKKTPEAFVKSCELFTFTENLNKRRTDNLVKVAGAKNEDTPTKLSKKDKKTIDKAFEISVNEDDAAYLSTMGNNIRKIDPSFDPRSYGHSSLTKLFQAVNNYEVVKKLENNINQPMVMKK